MDNGDGTITDDLTGLQWEKKDPNELDPNDPHSVHNQYSWSSSGTAPDGGAFTSFLRKLNGDDTGVGNCVSSDGSSQTGGFVNHCDWRLPTIVELQTILDTSVAGCGSDPLHPTPCIDPVFGPTAAAVYWSSTTRAGSPGKAWFINFNGGKFVNDLKLNAFSVRAVRGECACTGGKVLDPSGMCVCPTGKVDCDGTCRDTQTDANNCGTCGNVCAAGSVCNAGACCTPFCGLSTCGSNRCGGSCGECPSGSMCFGLNVRQCVTAAQCQSGTCGFFAECLSDADCPTNYVCTDPFCVGPACDASCGCPRNGDVCLLQSQS